MRSKAVNSLRTKGRKTPRCPLLHCGCRTGGSILLCCYPTFHNLRFRSYGSTFLYTGLSQLPFLGVRDEKPDRTFQESLV